MVEHSVEYFSFFSFPTFQSDEFLTFSFGDIEGFGGGFVNVCKEEKRNENKSNESFSIRTINYEIL